MTGKHDLLRGRGSSVESIIEGGVMFLNLDPYIPPRPERHGVELAARVGSGIERAFRACLALCSAFRRGIRAILWRGQNKSV
jgi:hypothetical protein